MDPSTGEIGLRLVRDGEPAAAWDEDDFTETPDIDAAGWEGTCNRRFDLERQRPGSTREREAGEFRIGPGARREVAGRFRIPLVACAMDGWEELRQECGAPGHPVVAFRVLAES